MTHTDPTPRRDKGTDAPRAFMIGHLRNVETCPDIAEYLERIDATMAPYGGRFVVHGARPVVYEGTWDGDLVILEFPDLVRAREWYASPEYQEILPLRTAHADSLILAIEGVREDYQAGEKAARLFPGRGTPTPLTR
ncbi:DUF1330 domain-containing protein [Streptomyces sp. NRRL F-5630]|uniref:DUF1330 domain-containing protein n=1 Tax=Streptomyces sp. NRRL F-5630 TaxID=1463864 RepID=UPI003EBD6962